MKEETTLSASKTKKPTAIKPADAPRHSDSKRDSQPRHAATAFRKKSQIRTDIDALRELFPNWKNDDLRLVLAESNGDVEMTIARISEGKTQPFSRVSHDNRRISQPLNVLVPTIAQRPLKKPLQAAEATASPAQPAEPATKEPQLAPKPAIVPEAPQPSVPIWSKIIGASVASQPAVPKVAVSAEPTALKPSTQEVKTTAQDLLEKVAFLKITANPTATDSATAAAAAATATATPKRPDVLTPPDNEPNSRLLKPSTASPQAIKATIAPPPGVPLPAGTAVSAKEISVGFATAASRYVNAQFCTDPLQVAPMPYQMTPFAYHQLHPGLGPQSQSSHLLLQGGNSFLAPGMGGSSVQASPASFYHSPFHMMAPHPNAAATSYYQVPAQAAPYGYSAMPTQPQPAEKFMFHPHAQPMIGAGSSSMATMGKGVSPQIQSAMGAPMIQEFTPGAPYYIPHSQAPQQFYPMASSQFVPREVSGPSSSLVEGAPHQKIAMAAHHSSGDLSRFSHHHGHASSGHQHSANFRPSQGGGNSATAASSAESSATGTARSYWK